MAKGIIGKDVNVRQRYLLATGALIVAGVLGGFVPIAIKIVLHELPQFTYLFLRLSIMMCFLVPLAWKNLRHIFPYWKIALPLGVLWIGYFLLFIAGLTSTTAFMSQVLSASAPLLVLMGNSYFNKERLQHTQIIGIIIGMIGAVFVIVSKTDSIQSTGTMYGNILIFLSSIGYAVYLMSTKRFIKDQSPLVITTSNMIIAWVITGLCMIWLEGTKGISLLSHISANAWMALLFMAIGAGVIMWSLINWGIKYGSTIAAGSMTYLNILIAGIFGALLLGEHVTQQSLIGGVLLIIGIYFSSIFPALNTKNNHT